MTDRTLGWCYKFGLMLVSPIAIPVILVLTAVMLVAAWVWIPWLTVERKADGSLKLTY